MAIEEIVQPSVGLSKIAISETHGENSPYFAGWKAYDENPYHEKDNPSGVIQMGLAENQVSFDLVEGYLEANREAASWGKNVSGFRENALFQDYHGLLTFRKVLHKCYGRFFACVAAAVAAMNSDSHDDNATVAYFCVLQLIGDSP
nr:1-aminocyclopropane-1-carboxylate synthase 7-like [Tanacetum cinerariifolium]